MIKTKTATKKEKKVSTPSKGFVSSFHVATKFKNKILVVTSDVVDKESLANTVKNAVDNGGVLVIPSNTSIYELPLK